MNNTCCGLSCCQRWLELRAAYEEGRKDEVAQEVVRTIREDGRPACRRAPVLLCRLTLDGWELPS
jgi:hypothetical protein